MVGTAPTSKPADPPLAFTGQTLGLCNSARRTSGLASESQILTGSSAHLQCSACRPPISIYLFECLGPAIVLGQTICAISLASPHRHSSAVFSHLKAYLRFGALQAASPAGRRSQNSIFSGLLHLLRRERIFVRIRSRAVKLSRHTELAAAGQSID